MTLSETSLSKLKKETQFNKKMELNMKATEINKEIEENKNKLKSFVNKILILVN